MTTTADMKLLEAPQLGEHVWHAFAYDHTIGEVSTRHADAIASLIFKYGLQSDTSRLRILEVGAYRHHAGYKLARQYNAEVVLSDISASALEDGRLVAREAGLDAEPTLVAADFHDLPFADGYFDIVFVASSVHHTRRPEVMLDELFRVARPGGIVYVFNEPCERLFCFYQFRSNRGEAFTPFEKALYDAGLMQTISSPFFGSRPEQLFGMIENDRIPLGLFLERFAHWGTTLELTLQPQRFEFDTAVTALDGPASRLEPQIFARLSAAIDPMRPLVAEVDRLLGFSLPFTTQVHAVSRHAAHALAARKGMDEQRWLADFCGAAVKAILRKGGDPASRPQTLFKREMIQQGTVWRDHPSHDPALRGLGEALLPDVFRATVHDQLLPWFPPEDWALFKEQYGVHTVVNHGTSGRVLLGDGLQSASAILVARYYAAIGDQPYRVRWYADDAVVDDQIVAIAESKMVRSLIPQGTRTIRMEICGVAGQPYHFVNSIHLAVLQLIPRRAQPAAV